MGLQSWLGLFTKPRFNGSWDLRLSGLFDCGVDYTGKSILDVGCNMGIIAYEISKRGPSFIHGIDNYSGALGVARAIFSAVPVESRFDQVELRSERSLGRVLNASYDLVLLLEIYHKVRAKSPQAAARSVEIIASKCAQTILVRGLEREDEELHHLIRRQGFSFIGFDQSSGTRKIARFDRQQ